MSFFEASFVFSAFVVLVVAFVIASIFGERKVEEFNAKQKLEHQEQIRRATMDRFTTVSGDKIKPITPDEVLAHRKVHIPNDVIDTWNKLIAEGWHLNKSTVYRRDIMAELRRLNYTDPVGSGYLDIEEFYMEAGWDVDYYTPDPGETWPPYFTFKRKATPDQGNPQR